MQDFEIPWHYVLAGCFTLLVVGQVSYCIYLYLFHSRPQAASSHKPHVCYADSSPSRHQSHDASLHRERRAARQASKWRQPKGTSEESLARSEIDPEAVRIRGSVSVEEVQVRSKRRPVGRRPVASPSSRRSRLPSWLKPNGGGSSRGNLKRKRSSDGSSGERPSRGKRARHSGGWHPRRSREPDYEYLRHRLKFLDANLPLRKHRLIGRRHHSLVDPVFGTTPRSTYSKNDVPGISSILGKENPSDKMRNGGLSSSEGPDDLASKRITPRRTSTVQFSYPERRLSNKSVETTRVSSFPGYETVGKVRTTADGGSPKYSASIPPLAPSCELPRRLLRARRTQAKSKERIVPYFIYLWPPPRPRARVVRRSEISKCYCCLRQSSVPPYYVIKY